MGGSPRSDLWPSRAFRAEPTMIGGLAPGQDVLAGLGHGAVGGGDDQDRAVHLGGAGDHVLDVVGVARAVDVGVVALLALVLDVTGGDGDAALALLGGVVDLVVGPDLAAVLGREHLGA